MSIFFPSIELLIIVVILILNPFVCFLLLTLSLIYTLEESSCYGFCLTCVSFFLVVATVLSFDDGLSPMIGFGDVVFEKGLGRSLVFVCIPSVRDCGLLLVGMLFGWSSCVFRRSVSSP